ncbi:ROK family protein [Catenulispora rubra]|uniref:ROK family protein n=1 Tax=Catenulispora rubra TaxID=280293 RepID=UPI001892480E|nr:ROK family protein [Catenulispora rubra]
MSVAATAGAVFAALDIGGTKIAAGLVTEDGVLLARTALPTPRGGSGADVLGVVGQVLSELTTDRHWPQVTRLGIGCAGPVDTAAGTVSPVNIPAWRDYRLVSAVKQLSQCRDLQVALCGDAIAMAAGEHWRGAARGRRNALCMVVSTGVGGGLVLDGRLFPGTTGNAGHIGHISVELDGKRCPCGARGCVELIAAGPAIARAAGCPDAAAAARAARAGDARARAAFDRAGQALATACATAAALVEVDLVVIGGGVAQAGDLLFGPLRRHLATCATLSFTSGLTVIPAALGADAGLVGAAACVR